MIHFDYNFNYRPKYDKVSAGKILLFEKGQIKTLKTSQMFNSFRVRNEGAWQKEGGMICTKVPILPRPLTRTFHVVPASSRDVGTHFYLGGLKNPKEHQAKFSQESKF